MKTPGGREANINIEDEDSSSDDEIPTLQNLDEEEVATTATTATPTTTEEEEDLPPVPVTILTGFLGSGKTTLIRHILTSPQHNRRIAVIENEFGGGEQMTAQQLTDKYGLTVNDMSTLSVETMIARDGTDGSDLADFIELSNGCVCCTVKDSLVETLEGLLSKRTDLDYVIIEASGMADPGPVASIFWLDEALHSRIRLDGIVACVDAKNIGYQLESTSSAIAVRDGEISRIHGSKEERGGGGDEAARQIAFADRIIVNKVDLLQSKNDNTGNNRSSSAADIESVLATLQGINPTAPIKVTAYSKIEEIGWILDANCFDAERAKDVELALNGTVEEGKVSYAQEVKTNIATLGKSCNNPSCTIDHTTSAFCLPCTVEPQPSAHQHTNAVGTIALFGRGSVDLHRINSWLASILWPDQDESDKVLRARLEATSLHKSSDVNTMRSDGFRRSQTIYRVKGFLSIKHAVDQITGKVIPHSNDWVDDGLDAGLVSRNNGLDRRRFIVQAVNDLWDVNPASHNLHWDDTTETRCCKLVVIGKWLDEGKLQSGFNECFNS